MANHIAVRLDRLALAEMSCIAGVGGDVRPLVRTAQSGRPIIALDGCPLHCVAKTLGRHGITADRHYDLSQMGVAKRAHEDFDAAEAARVLRRIAGDLASATAGETVAMPEGPGAIPPAPSPAATPPPSPEARAATTPKSGVVRFASPTCYWSDFKDC